MTDVRRALCLAVAGVVLALVGVGSYALVRVTLAYREATR